MQQADSLRAVLRTVFARPEYRWITRPDPWAALRWLYHVIQRWFDAIHRSHPRVTQALSAVLVVLLIGTAVRAAWLLVRSIRHSAAAHDAAAGRAPVRRDREWYRAEADRLAAAGRFAEAMQHDFLALVLALDAEQLVRFHASRTPAEYARAIQLPADRAAAFADLVRRLYLHVFARVPLDRDGLARWRDDAQLERFARAH